MRSWVGHQEHSCVLEESSSGEMKGEEDSGQRCSLWAIAVAIQLFFAVTKGLKCALLTLFSTEVILRETLQN